MTVSSFNVENLFAIYGEANTDKYVSVMVTQGLCSKGKEWQGGVGFFFFFFFFFLRGGVI